MRRNKQDSLVQKEAGTPVEYLNHSKPVTHITNLRPSPSHSNPMKPAKLPSFSHGHG